MIERAGSAGEWKFINAREFTSYGVPCARREMSVNVRIVLLMWTDVHGKIGYVASRRG